MIELDIFSKRDLRFLTLEIPNRYFNATIKEIGHEIVKEVARDYCENFDSSARHGIAPLFLGPVQTYKTYAACAIVRYAHFYAQIPTKFVSAPGDFGRLERRRFDPHTEYELDKLKNIPFLVIDDFPLIGSGSFAAAMLVEVVTCRFDAMLPTLMTGNLRIAKDDTTEIDARFGPQFGRRLYDMSEGFRGITFP